MLASLGQNCESTTNPSDPSEEVNGHRQKGIFVTLKSSQIYMPEIELLPFFPAKQGITRLEEY